jgi:hypothetical protein
MATDSLTVTLELMIGAEPICGVVQADGAAPRRFDGYVQLIGALEALHQAPAKRLDTSSEAAGAGA